VEQAAERISFDFLPGLPIVVETKPTLMSSDAGILPLRQFDDQIAFTERFVASLHDPRDPALIDHGFDEMVRQAWPDVSILVRSDAGFGVPWMYDACESAAAAEVSYTFGLAANPVLKKAAEPVLQRAVEQFAQTGEPARCFDQFLYRAGTWKDPRRVIVKAECDRLGTNLRFILTDRHGAGVVPQAAYEDYAERGESENRNKELKGGVLRTSCPTCAPHITGDARPASATFNRSSMNNPGQCRLSTQRLVQMLRHEVWGRALEEIASDGQTEDFATDPMPVTKSPELILAPAPPIAYARTG